MLRNCAKKIASAKSMIKSVKRSEWTEQIDHVNNCEIEFFWPFTCCKVIFYILFKSTSYIEPVINRTSGACLKDSISMPSIRHIREVISARAVVTVERI